MNDNEEKIINASLDRVKNEVVEKLDASDAYFIEKLGLSVEEIGLIQTYYPEIKAGEIMYANQFQKEYGLSIINKEVWLIKRWANIKVNGREMNIEKYEPMVGIEGARKAARNNAGKIGIPYKPVRTGYELKEKPVLIQVERTPENEAGYDFVLKKELVGWAELDLDENGDEVTRIEVVFSECAQKTSKGELTKFWKSMPTTMIQKVAEFRLLKKVYGLSLLKMEEDIDLSEMTEVQPVNTNGEPEKTKIEAFKELAGIKQAEEEKVINPEPIKDEVSLPPLPDDNTEIVKPENDEPPFEPDPAPIVEEKTELFNPEPDPKPEPKKEFTEEEKFEIIMDEAGITDSVLLEYINEIKGIKVKNVQDIKSGVDFKLFRSKIVKDRNNLIGILNFKKGFKV